MQEVDVLSSVKNERRVDILRKNWMSHEARWQMAVFQKFGWEEGNRLNKAIIKDMGKVMMYRLMNALEISHVESVAEFQAICSAAMDLYYPYPVFRYHFKPLSDTTILGVIENCGVYENVKKAGVLDFYDCGCFAMRSGWYEALGVDAEDKLGKSLRKGDNVCEILLGVKRWRKE